MPREFVNYTIEGRIATITINRPPVNAMNKQMRDELGEVFAEIAGNEEIWAIILTGAGDRAFVAGADINELRAVTPQTVLPRAREIHGLLNRIEDFPKPVIAAINSYALGAGLELAMVCDFRIAAENAHLGHPEVNLGIIPGAGGTQRLPRLVGRGMAKRLVFTAEIIDAQEALRIGLVEEVVPFGEALVRAKQVAERIVAKGPLAVRAAKRAINEGMQVGLPAALELEARFVAELIATEDRTEGLRAFLEKRPPQFKGK
jgi:enoyl-CoA hydratase